MDGACSDEEEALVHSHLATCAECTRVLEELRGTVEVLGTLPELRASPAFGAQLSRRLRTVAGPPERGELLWDRIAAWVRGPHARWPAVAVATAAVLIIGLTYIGLPERGPETPPAPPIREAAAATSVDDYLAAAVEIHDAFESVAQPLGSDGLVFVADNGDH